MSIAISDAARHVLRAAGWDEFQCADVEPIEAFLEKRGFRVSPVAVDFLREFHGFKADFSDRRGLSNDSGLSSLRFDVYEAMSQIEDEDKPFIDALADAPLCPVGRGGGVLLFLTSLGEMVILNEQWLGFSRVPSITEGMDIVLGVRRTPYYDGVSLTGEQVPPGFR